MKKIIITVLITLIVSLVVGSIPAYFFYAPAQMEMNALFPEAVPAIPDPVPAISGALFLIILFVMAFDKMGISDIRSGAITGLWFCALTFAFFDLTLLGITNLYSLEFAIADIALSTLLGAVQGAVIGWSLGKF